jgi:hypothetical protein
MRSWSAAVETVPGSNPLGSVYVVWFIPSAPASVFISARRRISLPATVAARMEAMLLPEGISNPSSSWRSVSCSPACTATTDWFRVPSEAAASASAVVTAIENPSCSPLIGYRSRVR